MPCPASSHIPRSPSWSYAPISRELSTTSALLRIVFLPQHRHRSPSSLSSKCGRTTATSERLLANCLPGSQRSAGALTRSWVNNRAATATNCGYVVEPPTTLSITPAHGAVLTCAAEDVGMVFLRGSASPRRGGAHRPKPPHRPPNWVTTHALSRTRLPPLPTPRPSEGRTYAHWSA